MLIINPPILSIMLHGSPTVQVISCCIVQSLRSKFCEDYSKLQESLKLGMSLQGTYLNKF